MFRLGFMGGSYWFRDRDTYKQMSLLHCRFRNICYLALYQHHFIDQNRRTCIRELTVASLTVFVGLYTFLHYTHIYNSYRYIRMCVAALCLILEGSWLVVGSSLAVLCSQKSRASHRVRIRRICLRSWVNAQLLKIKSTGSPRPADPEHFNPGRSFAWPELCSRSCHCPTPVSRWHITMTSGHL